MSELLTPVGRLVNGHPMVSHPVTDDKTKQPRINQDGTPLVNFYCGLAIQKGSETHWKDTPWGKVIYDAAVTAWPNGEHAQAAFSWKIEDGDSTVPNKNMKVPNQREGWAGHWIMHISNGFAFPCHPRGQLLPTQVMQTKEQVKSGDYVRFLVDVKSNQAAPGNTAGMYVNPKLMEMYQAGVEIQSASTADASAAFADDGVMPTNAVIDTNMPTQGIAPPINAGLAPPPGSAGAPPPIEPNPAILQPPVTYVHQGQPFSYDALIAAGWADAQIKALPTQ